MFVKARTIALIAALLAVPGILYGQLNFKLKGREIQVHGFISQGWAYVDQNRFLSFKNKGDWGLTDGALNLSSPITDKLRVGAQIYDRNIGKTGHGTVTLDWALGSYEFKPWLRVRGGRVKTVLGLYNDTQDMPFLSTWAFLPQSMYPNDQRGHTIAHIGGDVYGTIRIPKYGSFEYTAYGGQKPTDTKGGDYMALNTSGVHLDSVTGPTAGADLRWNTPIKGLLAGTSYMWQSISWDGWSYRNGVRTVFDIDPKQDSTYAYYFSYTFRNLQIDAEYRRNWKNQNPHSLGLINTADIRMWYASAAYRINRWVEFGTYHSRYYSDWRLLHSANDNHIFDQSITARVDIKKYWNWKFEQHWLDGFAAQGHWHGFYPAMTRITTGQLLLPKTQMFAVRTGVNF